MGQEKLEIEFEIHKLGQLYQIAFHWEFRKHVDQSNANKKSTANLNVFLNLLQCIQFEN